MLGSLNGNQRHRNSEMKSKGLDQNKNLDIKWEQNNIIPQIATGTADDSSDPLNTLDNQYINKKKTNSQKCLKLDVKNITSVMLVIQNFPIQVI